MSMLFMAEGTRRRSKSYQEKQAEQEVLDAQGEVQALTAAWESQTLKAWPVFGMLSAWAKCSGVRQDVSRTRGLRGCVACLIVSHGQDESTK